MHYFLKMHSDSLMPFAEALSHWMVKDDDEMEQHLDSVLKEQDVNYVATPKETKNGEDSDDTKSDDIKSDDIKPDDTNSLSFNVSALYNDEELMEKMKTEYLHQFKADDLYSAAMQFYDISSPSIGRSKSASNRLSAILLVCASISGHAEAHLHLGKQYLLGYGVETKYESAIYHFVRSAAMGSVDSRTFLGIMYLKGYRVKRNVSRAFTLLNESSRWMNPIAQRFLAELYEKGHQEQDKEDDFEIDRDYHIALRLAEKAVAGGSRKVESNRALIDNQFITEAATICGRMYCVHRNDFVNGLKYLEMAAADGNGDALCNVGHIYHIGVKGQVQSDLFKV